MAGLLIRLKFTLLRHSVTGMRLFGIALVVGGTALTWYLAVAAASDGVRADLLCLAFAVWAVGWTLYHSFSHPLCDSICTRDVLFYVGVHDYTDDHADNISPHR